jgi:hypothetical protein
VGFDDRGDCGRTAEGEMRPVVVKRSWNPGKNVKSPSGRTVQATRAIAVAGRGTKIYVRCSKFGFLSPFDLSHVLSTATIFPMMPERVDTPILTITR